MNRVRQRKADRQVASKRTWARERDGHTGRDREGKRERARERERKRKTVRAHGHTCGRCVSVCSQGRETEKERKREGETYPKGVRRRWQCSAIYLPVVSRHPRSVDDTVFATTLRGTPGRPPRVASKAVVGRLAVLCRMLPGSEYLLLRCRVQGCRGSNAGIRVTERKRRER